FPLSRAFPSHPVPPAPPPSPAGGGRLGWGAAPQGRKAPAPPACPHPDPPPCTGEGVMAAGMRPESGDHVGRHAHPAFASHPPLPPLAGEGWDGGTRRRGGRRQGYPLAPTPPPPPTPRVGGPAPAPTLG